MCNAHIPRNAHFTGFLRGFKSIDIRAALMILLDVELRDLSVVLQPILAQEVDGVGFLEKLIPHVGLVRQNPPNGRVAPLLLPGRRRDALSRQRLCDLERGVSHKEISEDATDYFCLFLVDNQPPVLALVVTEEVLVVQAIPAIGELLPLPPADVFADAPGFFLSEAAHYCEQ